MSLFIPKQIYLSVQKAETWNVDGGSHEVKVITIVLERKFWKFHLFTTRQFIPQCKVPVYDEEHASNNRINALALKEKETVMQWINEYIVRNKKENQ